jgi:hypothetical protein
MRHGHSNLSTPSHVQTQTEYLQLEQKVSVLVWSQGPEMQYWLSFKYCTELNESGKKQVNEDINSTMQSHTNPRSFALLTLLCIPCTSAYVLIYCRIFLQG